MSRPQVKITVSASGGPLNTPSYKDLTITGIGTDNTYTFLNQQGVLDAWCLDSATGISSNTTYTANVYSSYELGALATLGTPARIGNLYNLDLVNWIINQNFAANPQYNYGEIQAAIWTLLGDTYNSSGADLTRNGAVVASDVNSIIALAKANGENFVPDTNQFIGVIFDPFVVNGDGSVTPRQPLIAQIKAAKLGDLVWNDLNANGIQDTGESGIAGVTVNLTRDSNSNGIIESNEILATTTTNVSGLYEFRGLTPGLSYQVQFATPTGFDAVSPRQQGGNQTTDSDGLVSNVVILNPGEFNQTIDAGFYKYASLGDFVFNDGNNNGIQDAGEAGIGGVTVELINPANGSVIATTTTDGIGAYTFTGLTPGDYQVKFTSPTGYVFSTANVGDDTKDSDANTSTGLTQTVTLTSGEFNGTLDAGLVQLASLGDKVFHDLDADGIQDAGEQGIANASVKLLDTAGNVIATTTTDGDGLYSFTNLQPGDYKVQFVQPTGFNGVSLANVGGDDSVDSDGLISDVVNLSPGENDTTVDAGFYKTASLGDFVFNDGNNNGIQDAGEAGIGEVTVELINPADGSVIATTTTDETGAYTFTGLTPGDYQVKFTSPTDYVFSTADQGGDDTVDSDANTSTGLTQTVTLTSGEFNGTLDAGLVQLASLGDFVFEDSNANGIQDAWEQGIAEASVNLLDTAGNVIATTTTDGDGLYSFTNLQPGDYKVQFVQPAGFSGVSPSNVGGDDSVDSDGLISDVVNLSPGENDTTVDAGFYKTASLGDFVFNDGNNNGIQDIGEAGIGGVTVELINPANGSVIASVITDDNGGYQFSGLTPGDYQVKFTSPTGYVFSTAYQGGDDTVDSDANTSTGLTQTVTLTSGEFNGTLDAGLVQLASLGDKVFHDLDADGIQDAGEQGIANASVKLLDTAGNVIATTTTDGDGLYSFINLQPGDYKVQFVQPTDFNGVSLANVGGDDSVDSDGLISDVVNLSPGENDTTVDAGFYKTASLGDFVFNDGNNNGIQDAGEAGIGGVTVKLINPANGNVISTTTTDGAGAYTFTGLTPGDYQVKFISPTGYSFTAANQGGNDAVDSDANPSTGLTQTVTLTSGEYNGTLDAGLVQLASLGDKVFHDLDADGIQDAGEQGIANASVKLLDTAGNVIATTTTDGDGLYSFTNLQPGDYKVQFVQPTGFNGVSLANVGGDDSVDSDAASNLTTGVVNLSPGENDTTVDAGFYKTASLGNFVFNDVNNNGIQEASEAGVAGVTVTLTGGGADGLISTTADNTTITTTTNASGKYNFAGLTPGQEYQVGFSNLPAGYQFTQANAGTDDALDSDANTSTGKTQIVTLASGENNTTLDAGIYQNAGDLSITKTNGLTTVSPGQQITYTIVAQNNGLITATNALVSDIIPSNLTNVTWTSVATGGATDNQSSGTGSINDYVTLTAGSSITYTVTGTVAPNALTPVYNTPTTINLTSNSSSALNGTAGNIRNFSANGISVNASAFSSTSTGTWNTAYLGLYGSYGLGVTDGGENGSNGTHHIDNDGRNNYVLLEFSDSVVIDKAALSYVVGDSDISVWIGNFNNPYTNHLTLNSSVLSSFGFTEINLGGSSDRNADINASNIVGNAVVIAAKVGDTNDEFKLKSLDIIKATTQTGGSLVNTATITAPTGFTDTNSNNNSATDTDTIVASSTVRIGDRVWYDTNANGIQETGEAGVAGVAVNLFNQAGTQVGTTTTDTNGFYQFTANTNSTYSVQFVQPTGFSGFTTANVGNDGADSDVVNANGTTAQFLVGTTDNLTIDAGLIKNIGDLSITKTDGLTTVTAGQQLTYTIVVSNNGFITATNALVTDAIPALLTNVTWTSVASGGATGNETSGTGNINDYVTLTGGSSITYTVNGTVAANAVSSSSTYTDTRFDFNGNSSSDGTDGNTRTFTKDGITVTARAFSRVDGTNGAWSKAYLGSYTGGLGVTDSSESSSYHRVDNGGGRDNYVLFQFSEAVVVDSAYLQYVVTDSDTSVWIGNFNNTITTLSDSVLNSFGFTEVNLGSGSDRWADINAGNYLGNTLVIAAKTDDTNDNFKIRHLDIQKPVAPTTVSLTNTATVTAPTGFTDTNTSNNSATDTDTVTAAPTVPSAPGVRTPGFWQNTEWQKFWDGIQGNEPAQKTQPNFAKSDLLFAPYTNSAQAGKVLDPVSGQYDIGLLIGDFNRNGKTDAGEDTLFYTRAQALQMVDASAHPNGDKRYDLGRSLVAGWLNYLAGNPIDTANPTDKDERYYINEGINWLQGFTPDENGDKKGDGAIYQMTGSSVSSPQLTNSYWNLGISSASNLPSSYKSNTNVLYPLESGSVINTNLDNYNNGLGLADNVFYGGNA
ncbi:SdrD B-like domain-containing protein [Trichormus variabilis]|uniref:SdrD B-like domain-containing protein n=1 Tax=Anabaena variabilis TaxID=264691 RepID=UPI001682C4C0|nr:SdrD B-like domain-containing protein [Trichormus variabilis]MBD2625791.1 carboxypeptidase regulatory-like domain-containing protein [Trichormus variabilis FACHB-164]